MRKIAIFLPLVTLALLALPVDSPLYAQNGTTVFINEIIQDPSPVADGSGESFEPHNPTGVSIDIDGWTIRDNDLDSLTVAGDPIGYTVFQCPQAKLVTSIPTVSLCSCPLARSLV